MRCRQTSFRFWQILFVECRLASSFFKLWPMYSRFSRDVTTAISVCRTIYSEKNLEGHFAIVLYTNMAVSPREWKPRIALHTTRNARDAPDKRGSHSFPPSLPVFFFACNCHTFFFMLAVTEYIILNRKRRKKYNSVNNLFAKMLNQFFYLLLSSALASLSASICLRMILFGE